MIYIVSHKDVALPKLIGYQPIQVGGAQEDFPGYIRDNTGDNISARNANYCELTALYWIWKNVDAPFKGLVHYRRYFGRRSLSSRPRDILGYEALCGLLKDADIVVARPALYHVSAREQLLMDCCAPEHFELLRRTVEALCPDYLGDFDAFFAGNRASQYNMMFCSGQRFDAYCAWLFPILFEMEKGVDLTGESDYRKRLYGFLSERLMNVWVRHNRLRAVRVPVVSTDYTLVDHLTYLRRDVTNDIRFRLNHPRVRGEAK